jgi:hypothetical protein
MGFTNNVVDGQIILASWGNEIRDRTMQVFATVAERDSQWPSPPNGAHCVTLDTGTVWLRRAGVWAATAGQLVGKGTGAIADVGYTSTGLRDLFLVSVTAVPYATTMWARVDIQFGSGTAAQEFVADLYMNASASATATFGTFQAVALKMAAVPLMISWNVAASADPGWKFRINPLTAAAGNVFHTLGSWSWQMFAQ